MPKCGAKKLHHTTDLASIKSLSVEWGHEGETKTGRERTSEGGKRKTRRDRKRERSEMAGGPFKHHTWSAWW